MKKIFATTALAVGLVAASGTAMAMTSFDFPALEVILGERNLVAGDFPINSTTYPTAVSGGTHSIVSMSATGNGDFNAYLDDQLSGRDAGLGVCSTAGGACDGTTDDNIGATLNTPGNPSETVTLTFASAVTLQSVVTRDQDHFLPSASSLFTATDTFTVSVDGGAATLFSFSDLVDLSGLGVGTSFEFGYVPNPAPPGTDTLTGAFYIDTVTAVPIPAALPLFATALAGLGVFGWRKKRHQTA